MTYVKRLHNDTVATCLEPEAMGIVKEDGIGFYQLNGRNYLGNYEIVALEEIQPDQELLKAQIAALTERGEFLENIIAEMAMKIY